MAEVTSDLNTEAESHSQIRKIKKPKRLYESSSNSEEEQTDCIFERPAKISKSYGRPTKNSNSYSRPAKNSKSYGLY